MFTNKQIRNRWHHQTKLERTLIICVSLSVTAIVILVFVLIFKTQTFSLSEECRTPACLSAAAGIISQIDTNQNACLDFFGFACGANDGTSRNLLEEENRLIESLYKRTSSKSDSLLVASQRELYHACVNETTTMTDSFKVISSILATLGGWPVVLGQVWNERNFDWLEMSYKLRQLGCLHNVFLGLDIVPDGHREDKYIFKVFMPNIDQIQSGVFDDHDPVGFLTDVAIAFGAEVHVALNEMSDVYQLVQDLRWLQSRISIQDGRNIPRRVTVAQFQHEYGNINWLQFINKISGSSAAISSKDYVLFPPEETLDDWFELLRKTPKRTQANYMLWLVVHEFLPYVTVELQKRGVKPKIQTEPGLTISEFCIKQIEKRFTPSPIRVEYVKTVVTEKKKQLAEHYLLFLKGELMKVTQRVKWQDEVYRQTALDVVQELVVVVGMPDVYFPPDTLQSLLIEQEIVSGNFLSMLTQASKHHWSNLYNLVWKSPANSSFWTNYKNVPLVWSARNEISLRVPAYLLLNGAFDVDQALPINYANLGLALGPALYQILKLPFLQFDAAELTEDWSKYIRCVAHSNTLGKMRTDRFLGYFLGIKLAYAAYQENLLGSLVEQQLINVNYTSKQVFWISVAQQVYSGTFFAPYKDDQMAMSLFQKVIDSDEQLFTDFNCPVPNVFEGCNL